MADELNEEPPHLLKATMKFFSIAVGMIILPKIAFEVMASDPPAFTGNSPFGNIDYILAMGGIIAVLLATEAFFPKLSKVKLIFGVAGAIMAVFYFWSLIGEGAFDVSIGGASLHLDISALSVLILCSLLVSCFIPISRFVSARKESARNEGGSSLNIDNLPEVEPDGRPVSSSPGLIGLFLDAPDPPPPDFDPSSIRMPAVSIRSMKNISHLAANVNDNGRYRYH